MGHVNRLAACGAGAGAVLCVLGSAPLLRGQQPSPASGPGAKTTADDHQNMMAQLGIRKLRPGPSGNASAPNQANYDEATANPFPHLPEVLTLDNGQG